MAKSIAFSAEALLHEHDFKATPLRIALLERLYESRKPLSALVLVKKTRRLKADTATVYRALGAFVGRGIVRELHLSENARSYELVRIKHEHHIVCQQCSAIEAIPFCLRSIEISAMEKSRQFKTIFSHSLSFAGTCKKCARAVR